MDINELLQGVECSCGKFHTCDIKYVYIERGAIDHLKEICADYQKILIVADENTFGVAGAQTLAALEGKTIEQCIFTGAKILVPNEEAIDAVNAKLGDAELIVGIGSGVIQDLCKYVAFNHKMPYLVVATAPSMDGYASSGAAMITDGMKVTYSAGMPMAILADTQVLKDAPLEMLKAGYGDIIGKFSSLNDWKLSHCIHGEYLCDYIYDLTFEQIQGTLKLASGILKRDEQSIATLMEALVVIGIMMSFAGSSRPASGSEHHLSHFFEITGIIEGTDYFSHGIDVAYSTVITAQIREEILKKQFPKEIFRPTPADYKAAMESVYKSVAQGCMDLQEKMGRYTAELAPIYLEKEQEIRAILKEMPTAKEIEEMLALVELDMKEFYEFYGEKKIRDAIVYAKDLKDRYTVLWLNYDLFGA